jgi:hypothetical protein
MEHIVIPFAANKLIALDHSICMAEAYKVMTESSELGDLLHPDDDDDEEIDEVKKATQDFMKQYGRDSFKGRWRKAKMEREFASVISLF